MSKLGRKPITIPEDVKVTYDNETVKVTGPKGELEYKLRLDCDIEIKDNLLKIIPKRDDKFSKSLFGLTRAKIQNMVIGVKDGFKKVLELIGVGFRAELAGDKLILNLGFSHPVEIKVQKDIELKVEKNKIKISGSDKEKVGQIAAKIRAIKPPEPYKGKGIKYAQEIIKKKPGKMVAKTEGEGA